MSKVERNDYIDIFLGMAMLLVVLQHTISGSAKNIESSMIFNYARRIQS